MVPFISELMEVLNISLTIGTTTITLGGLALGYVFVQVGVALYKRLRVLDGKIDTSLTGYFEESGGDYDSYGNHYSGTGLDGRANWNK